jgi:hypothetical protein
MRNNSGASHQRKNQFFAPTPLMVTALALLLCARATAADIPEQYRPLFQTLEANLRENAKLYPIEETRPRPLVCPSLCPAASVFNPWESDRQWRDVLATLDAFKGIGAKGVLVQIVAPDLAYGDKQRIIDFYQRLAAEVRSRGMTLYVEHFVNTPFKANGARAPGKKPAASPELKDNAEGRAEFLQVLEQEVTLIYEEIKPDYLSILTEPELSIHQQLHLTFSAADLGNWTDEVAARLKKTGASPKTLLGAGGVTFEPEEFFLTVAKGRSVDYLDMHLYIIKMKGEDQLAKLSELIRKVRETRPDMKCAIGEAWLFKQGKDGPKATVPEIFARDNFSFWSPLDQGFLKMLIGFSQRENISVVVPYFSQYFFAYYTFGDSESASLPPWPASVKVSWGRALERVHKVELSSTGKALSEVLNAGNRK